ncbi:MAG: hypothetical protein ACRC5T_13100 [Cetobacterium sp.]
MYIIEEQIGNFSKVVLETEEFYEFQEYLEKRYEEYLENDGCDSEESRELFYSSFYVSEK